MKHSRLSNAVTKQVERRILDMLVARTPGWMFPDLFTTVGILGSLLVLVGYWLTNNNSLFLWLVNLGLALNWLGDSMDGSLARYRKIERPKFGYFIDHAVDVVSVFLVGLGLGLSPYLKLEIALLVITGYMMMMLLVSLMTFVQGKFRMSFGRVGPTEMRLMLIAANSAVFVVQQNGYPLLKMIVGAFTALDLAALLLALVLLAGFLLATIEHANELAELEARD